MLIQLQLTLKKINGSVNIVNFLENQQKVTTNIFA
jgi:hypothetical protein